MAGHDRGRFGLRSSWVAWDSYHRVPPNPGTSAPASPSANALPASGCGPRGGSLSSSGPSCSSSCPAQSGCGPGAPRSSPAPRGSGGRRGSRRRWRPRHTTLVGPRWRLPRRTRRGRARPSPPPPPRRPGFRRRTRSLCATDLPVKFG